MALRQCPGAPDLKPGDVLTTGTWTDAWPMSPGQCWSGAFVLPQAQGVNTVRMTRQIER